MRGAKPWHRRHAILYGTKFRFLGDKATDVLRPKVETAPTLGWVPRRSRPLVRLVRAQNLHYREKVADGPSYFVVPRSSGVVLL